MPVVLQKHLASAHMTKESNNILVSPVILEDVLVVFNLTCLLWLFIRGNPCERLQATAISEITEKQIKAM